MGAPMLAVIHCEPSIKWQLPFAEKFAAGCRNLGIEWQITSDRSRHDEGFPVLLGTTFWKNIENDGGHYLLVDRCQYGDTDKWVTLSWNGHGRDANYKVPPGNPAWRWEKYGVELQPWRRRMINHVVMCGQLPVPFGWYAQMFHYCHAFRPHPADLSNPTSLPIDRSWDRMDMAVTMSSTIANETVMRGIPTVATSSRSMAWNVTSHHPMDAPYLGDRLEWCHWLAWCQWSHDEITEGVPHLWD